MIHIRSFEMADTAAVIDLIINIQQKEFNVPVTLAEQPDLYKIPEFYQKDGGNFWVAVNETNEIVGTIALIDCTEGVGCIRKMFVKKEYRGAKYGIAQNLINKLESHAQKHTINHVFLGTIPRLEAANVFYQKNGYIQIKKSNLPSVFPIMQVDTVFYEKTLNPINAQIIEYDTAYASDFLDINIEWISEHFTPEPHDYEQLKRPELILNEGGKIFLLKENDQILGTAAIVHEGIGHYELAKMAVRPAAKGKGYGKWLCQHCIDIAKQLKAKRLYLVSNRVQEVAIIMYKQLGFVEIPLGDVAYERANIKMEFFDL